MADLEMPPETQSSSTLSSFWGFVAEAQDRIAQAFGVSPAEVLMDAWPFAAGKLLDTRLSFPREAPIVIEVVHVGPKLGAAGEELLGERLTRALGSEVSLRDVAISPELIVKNRGEGTAFLHAAWPLLQHITHVPGLRACIEMPAAQSGDTTTKKSVKEAAAKNRHSKETLSDDKNDLGIADLLRTLFTSEGERVEWHDAEMWRLLMTTESCAVSKASTSETAKTTSSPP